MLFTLHKCSVALVALGPGHDAVEEVAIELQSPDVAHRPARDGNNYTLCGFASDMTLQPKPSGPEQMLVGSSSCSNPLC